MPKRDVEGELERLKALRHSTLNEEVVAHLKKALRDPVNVITARGAQLAAELNVRELIPDLRDAFARLFIDPVKRDPQCMGKTALAKALKDLEHTESETYLRGVRHVQKEPVWGGEEDTAATLRGTCLLALVQCLDIPIRDVLVCLIDGLADNMPSVREDATRALLHLGTPETALLLRLKARLGDTDPALTGAALEAILKLEEERALDFVTGFLKHSDEEVAEQAAVAMAASRLPAAIEALTACFERERGRGRWELIVFGLGASRLDSATTFLCELLRTGRPREAMAALKALEAHRQNEQVMATVRFAVAQRNEPDLQSYFDRQFRTP